ncbi:Bin/amphiphysin/Rvs domain for vesicular trafficking-domain-containing protein [Gongronella butleri]|nr:Bin/amphiphysin/Rvs domain for vesicular trafficking-domain-containing protein [Gongronella butleri]
MMSEGESGIKVVDAEAQGGAQGAPASPTSLNPNLVLNNALDGLATFSSKLNPFAQKLNKGFGQVRQYAQERLGTAEDITELPQEYKDLEKRVDALRAVHVQLLKVAKTFNQPAYDYPTQIQESLVGFSSSVATQFQQLSLSPADRALAEQQTALDASKQHPKTLHHAISRVAQQGAEAVGIDEPLGNALFKVATIQDKIGNARSNMDHEIVSKFNQPMQTTLNASIEQAMKARRQVQSTRLSLDACKGRYRTARPEKSEAARLEVEQAEDHFVAAVEEATTQMKLALENPEPLRNLADFVNAQMTFYKEAQALLADLVPELDEIQVTQESLYRNSRE